MTAELIEREAPTAEPGEGLPEAIAEILGLPVEQLRPLPRVA